MHALDGVLLTIASARSSGLVGESGSGKSTFGKTLVGLHDKTAGTVSFSRRAAAGALPAARLPPPGAAQMQMIFQDPYSSLNPRMTVGEIVGEGCACKQRLRGADIRDRGRRLAARGSGSTPDHMSRYPHEFSGGQRQRIGIARALILEPEFVVCDEPISALDVSVQAQIVSLLDELQASLGLTLLFIAHDLSMVRYVSRPHGGDVPRHAGRG